MGETPSVGLGAGDPVREFTPEEQRRLTENLLVLTGRVHRGEFSANRIDRDFMCTLHRELFAGVRDHAGRCRSRDAGSEFLTYGPHRSHHRSDVPKSIDEILESVERSIRSFEDNPDDPDYDEKAIRLALWAHARMIRIHPFEDGNGRTGRLLLGTILVKLGLRPIPVEACKQEYTTVLNHYYTTGEIQPLLDLYLRLYTFPSP